MDTQVKFPKPLQWFIKIGIALSGIVGLMLVVEESHNGGWRFFIIVCIELFTLLYGLWVTKFLDE
jgi:hypothetical protein